MPSSAGKKQRQGLVEREAQRIRVTGQGQPFVRVVAAAFDVYLFFFNDTATIEIYTLSLHDALPIWMPADFVFALPALPVEEPGYEPASNRSEEHTSELQSHVNLVCRLLLEKKK